MHLTSLKIEKLIKDCKRFNKNAQMQLYNQYASSFRAICIRYSQFTDEAEDLLQEGFLKIFSKISKYNGTGSFEGWMKRIIINNAISHYRLHASIPRHLELSNEHETADNNLYHDEINEAPGIIEELYSLISDQVISNEDILKLVLELPEQYRFVFNLYIIEGYSHKEISELLNITVQNSKIRLMRSRKLMQDKIISFTESILSKKEII